MAGLFNNASMKKCIPVLAAAALAALLGLGQFATKLKAADQDQNQMRVMTEIILITIKVTPNSTALFREVRF